MMATQRRISLPNSLDLGRRPQKVRLELLLTYSRWPATAANLLVLLRRQVYSGQPEEDATLAWDAAAARWVRRNLLRLL